MGGGPNLYVYIQNNPLKNFDIFGLSSINCQEGYWRGKGGIVGANIIIAKEIVLEVRLNCDCWECQIRYKCTHKGITFLGGAMFGAASAQQIYDGAVFAQNCEVSTGLFGVSSVKIEYREGGFVDIVGIGFGFIGYMECYNELTKCKKLQ